MNDLKQVFITSEQFEVKLANNELYAGFVIGEGYAGFYPQIYYSDAGEGAAAAPGSRFMPSECMVVWIQYLDTSPEMKMKSLGEDPSKWSDFWGSTKLQRFAAQEFAAGHNGKVVDEGKSSIHVEYVEKIGSYGNAFNLTRVQYFRKDGTLIPQNGEITAYEPNFWGKIQESRLGRTWVGKVAYGILDDAWITLQCFTTGHYNSTHLSGAFTVGQETVDAGISTLMTFVPIGSVGKGEKVMNVAQFNSLYKGTGINTVKKSGTEALKRHNMSVREMETFRKAYNWFSVPSTAIPYIIENDSIR